MVPTMTVARRRRRRVSVSPEPGRRRPFVDPSSTFGYANRNGRARACWVVGAEAPLRRCAVIATILIPLDGSELARGAVPYGTALARTAGARVVLFQAVSVVP